MKLLLTSAGLTNPTLTQALEALTGKPARSTKLLHIPTATLADDGNKHALITELDHLVSLGYDVDVLDVTGMPESIWRPRLEASEVIYVCGGNVYWLAAQLQASGVAAALPELLRSRVYVGASAGSTVTSQHQASTLAPVFSEEADAALAPPTTHGLGLVDFLVKAHFNNPGRPERSTERLAAAAAQLSFPLYALDDQSAVRVDGDDVRVVGEGQWQLFDRQPSA